MIYSEREQLYKRVRNATSNTAVKLKCVEEVGELIKELSSIQCELLKGREVKRELIENTADEVADLFVTLENVTGENIDYLVGKRMNFKVNRLEKRYRDGELTKNMIGLK